MIICYMGTPGSGKSYEAALRIIENLKRGRKVYAHLDGIELTECREIMRVYSDLYGALDDRLIYVSKEEVGTFYKNIEKGSFVIVDECHKYFSNRDWQTQKNKEFNEWCSTHRHVGCDVLLITQHIDKIDSHLRSLVEWTYKFRKINFFGSMVQNRYIEYVYSQDDVNGDHLSHKTKSYDRKIFPVYKSYAGKEVKELKVMKGTNLFRHPVFYGIGLVVAVFCVLAAKSPTLRGDWFGTKAQLAKAEAMKVKGGKGSVTYLQQKPVEVAQPLVKENVAPGGEKVKIESLDAADPLVEVRKNDEKEQENFTRKKLVLLREARAAHESKGVTYLDCVDNICSLRQ